MRPPLKIIFLTNLFPNTNAQSFGTYNYSRAKVLQDLGHEICVICPIGLTPSLFNLFPIPKFLMIFREFRKRNSIPKVSTYDGINVHYPKWFWLPKKLFWTTEVDFMDFFTGKYIRNVINNLKPDLIITSWLHPFGTYSKYLKRHFDIPVFVICEGGDILELPYVYRGFDSILKSVNSNSDLVIFVSQWQRKKALDSHFFEKHVTINNGFRSDVFQFCNHKPKGKRLKIISVGNLYHVKGHDVLLKALKLIDIDYELLIIGDGDKKEEYVKFIGENQMQSKVRIIAPMKQESLVEYLNLANVCCMPSRSEGFSIAGLEALACGLPLIASTVGGFLDIVENGVNGFLVPVEDSGAL